MEGICKDKGVNYNNGAEPVPDEAGFREELVS